MPHVPALIQLTSSMNKHEKSSTENLIISRGIFNLSFVRRTNLCYDMARPMLRFLSKSVLSILDKFKHYRKFAFAVTKTFKVYFILNSRKLETIVNFFKSLSK